MKEKNKKSLDDALRNLPEYNPEFGLWDKIDAGLNQAKADEVLQSAIAHLPTYEPDESVWNTIEKALPKSARIRRLNWLRAAAACIVLVVGIGLANYLQGEIVEPLADAQISYSEEKIVLVQNDFANIDDDSEAFSFVLRACQKQIPTCKTPEFVQLKVELKDLDFAKQRLLKNITPYDTDPTHKIQLAKIERERSDVLKKLVAMI